jgi:RNA polymerase sigma-70 factor (ECF subfamily)
VAPSDSETALLGPETALPDPETALLRRVALGDEASLAELYDRLSPLAYGLSLRMASDTLIAQDAVQEAFLRVWRRARSFDRKRGPARAWVLRIVRNVTIDQLRSRAIRDRSELRAAAEPRAADPPRPDDLAVQAETRAGLRNALACLPDQQRRMIEIAYFQGLSHSEIAELENLPLGTVKTRIRDGVLRLRRLAEEGKLDD